MLMVLVENTLIQKGGYARKLNPVFLFIHHLSSEGVPLKYT